MKKIQKKTVKKSIKKSPNLQKAPASLESKALLKKPLEVLQIVEILPPSKDVLKIYESPAGPGWNDKMQALVGQKMLVHASKTATDGRQIVNLASENGYVRFWWLAVHLKVVGEFKPLQVPAVRCDNLKELDAALATIRQACPYARWKTGHALTENRDQLINTQFPLIVNIAGSLDLGVWTIDPKDPLEPTAVSLAQLKSVLECGGRLAVITGTPK